MTDHYTHDGFKAATRYVAMALKEIGQIDIHKLSREEQDTKQECTIALRKWRDWLENETARHIPRE